MEEGKALYADICVCCGEPVPEGRMVCYACETENQTMIPCKSKRLAKGIRKKGRHKKEKANAPRD